MKAVFASAFFWHLELWRHMLAANRRIAAYTERKTERGGGVAIHRTARVLTGH